MSHLYYHTSSRVLYVGSMSTWKLCRVVSPESCGYLQLQMAHPVTVQALLHPASWMSNPERNFCHHTVGFGKGPGGGFHGKDQTVFFPGETCCPWVRAFSAPLSHRFHISGVFKRNFHFTVLLLASFPISQPHLLGIY